VPLSLLPYKFHYLLENLAGLRPQNRRRDRIYMIFFSHLCAVGSQTEVAQNIFQIFIRYSVTFLYDDQVDTHDHDMPLRHEKMYENANQPAAPYKFVKIHLKDMHLYGYFRDGRIFTSATRLLCPGNLNAPKKCHKFGLDFFWEHYFG
jgi:hypothetical protein